MSERSEDPLVLIYQSMKDSGLEWFPILYTILLIWAGFLSITAIRKARTSQGAIAWSVALITMPVITIPLYILFGRSKFIGHVDFRRQSGKEVAPFLKGFKESALAAQVPQDELTTEERVLQKLAELPWLKGNNIEILKEGRETFEAVFKAIDEAESYLLLQFFIVKEDRIGEKLQDKLMAAAKKGIKVYFIYDAIGCYDVSDDFWDRMRNSGVDVAAFHITEKRSRRLQINFRNHRKIVVADGQIGFFGGHNIGEEYAGDHHKLGRWRDTFCRVDGPAVISLQVSFLEDWYFVNSDCTPDNLPTLSWVLPPLDKGEEVLILPSGPADTIETCGLMFTTIIHQAEKRLWMASPYFIPDGKIQAALTLAALSGVDVRILLPSKPDHKMVYWARQDFYEKLQEAGVKFYLYQKGFMHQKVFLVDDELAGVGTANMDNRSFRLNFELTGLFRGEKIVQNIHEMLLADFKESEELPLFLLREKPLCLQVLVRVCRLFSPML